MSHVRIRRAGPADADFLLGLANHEDVEPFMGAVAARDRETILAELQRSLAEPDGFGRFVIEVGGEPAGMMGFEVANRRSRIARLERLAVHPGFRGRRLADEAARLFQRHLLVELGYHRLELECYGFNERAIRHAERVGFVREGVKRRAYRRHGAWVDGILFSLIREDLGLEPDVDRVSDAPVISGATLLEDHVERFNAGVRTGDFGSMLERFTDDAELVFEGVPVGPFVGRETIAQAYRERPPDDELRILDVSERDGVIVAGYAWIKAPETRTGELRLTRAGDRIGKLVVTFEESRGPS